MNEVIKPAKLTISKYIVDYADRTPASIQQRISRQVIRSAGRSHSKWQVKTELCLHYIRRISTALIPRLKVTDGLVTINPADTSGADSVWKDGQIEVYLDAGTYIVSELEAEGNSLPSNTVKVTDAENKENNAADKEVTIAEEGSGKADFYNRETLAASALTKKEK